MWRKLYLLQVRYRTITRSRNRKEHKRGVQCAGNSANWGHPLCCANVGCASIHARLAKTVVHKVGRRFPWYTHASTSALRLIKKSKMSFLEPSEYADSDGKWHTICIFEQIRFFLPQKNMKLAWSSYFQRKEYDGYIIFSGNILTQQCPDVHGRKISTSCVTYHRALYRCSAVKQTSDRTTPDSLCAPSISL